MKEETRYLAGAGEMGRLIAAFDWSKTSIGPASAWPHTLKTSLSMILHSPVPIVMLWGADGIMLYNDAYSVFAGGRHPRLLGSPVLQGWPEVAGLNRRVMETGMRGETLSFKSEQLVLHRHGAPEEVWLDLDYSPVIDENGRPVGVLAIVVETTERVRAERALRESELRFRNMADSAPVMIWTTDANAYCTYLNQRWYEFTGQTPAQAEGFGWLEATHPDDKAVVQRVFLKANAAREGFALEYRLRRSDGEYRWASDAASPRFDADGAFLGYVGSVIDITARKEVEELQMRLQRELQLEVAQRTRERDRIWRVSHDLLLVADVKDTWLNVNPAFERTLGWSEADLVGRTSEWLLHPDDLAPTRQELARLLGAGKTVRFENRLRHSDGSYRWLSWVSSIDQDRIFGVARDVTEEKAAAEALADAQEALRQSQKMEAIGHLTGGVAHDFNNLLTIVIGNIDTIERNLGKLEPGPGMDRLRRAAENALSGARRAASLTQRLLAFSRRQPLDPKPVDANKLVQAMSEMLTRTLGEHVEVQTVLAGGLWRTEADHNQLEAALLNLAVNARDAMPAGGKLTIETANTHLDEAYASTTGEVIPGQYVAICVSDTGIGMSGETLARAFEPFFTTKPTGHGTGLGLSQVYGFVKQSGGHVKIYSELGEGTTVKIYLPRLLKELGEDEAIETATVPDSPSGESVLVVEDEDGVRQYTAEILRELGYHVIDAPDAATALRILERNPRVRLLFTDVGLPGMNGRELAEQARGRLPELKVLFTTGYARNAIVHHGRLDPGVDLIGKPFTYATLAAKIREVLDGPHSG